jgi:hypothetical protein
MPYSGRTCQRFHGWRIPRLIFPESLALLIASAIVSLLSDTKFFLMAGHSYVSDLRAPKLMFASGGEYMMNVGEAHKIPPLLPLSVLPATNLRGIMMHKPTPFDPPSFFIHLKI